MDANEYLVTNSHNFPYRNWLEGKLVEKRGSKHEAVHGVIFTQLLKCGRHGCRNNKQIIFSDMTRVIPRVPGVDFRFPACDH
ncbi:hypothetical protein NXY25_04270 [Bacteroides thetaiotaomicron]|nr:hypothetical protein [Bacteroides thetaiotaomicron]